MNLLDGVKNISKIVKQYNDLELNQQIIDLTQQALDLINENVRLTQENEELKKSNDLESRIIRHPENFITLKDESEDIRYCAVCWGNEHKLIQLRINDDEYCEFICIKCKNCGIYDKNRHDIKVKKQSKQFDDINSFTF